MKTFTYDELMAWESSEPPSIITSGVLVTGGRLIIFGKFKSWKSILAMHLGICVSEGLPWFGFKTTKSKVHIFQSEIPLGPFRTRLLKFAAGNGVHPRNIHFTYEPYLKLDSGYGIDAMEKELKASGARVAIVDPLYKAVGGHITDTYDVSKLTDNIDLLANRTGVSIILIHHTRKTILTSGGMIDLDSEEMIGSSYLTDWCDSAISVKTESELSENFRLKFTCMRHAEQELKPIEAHISRTDLRVHHHRIAVIEDAEQVIDRIGG